jgi:hypothetical protein
MARRSVLEYVQEEGVQVVSVAAVSVSSWRRRRWRWPAIPARNRGAGELGSQEGEWFERREREREEGSQIDGNLHRCRRSTPDRVLNNG